MESGHAMHSFCQRLFEKLDQGSQWDNEYEINVVLKECLKEIKPTEIKGTTGLAPLDEYIDETKIMFRESATRYITAEIAALDHI